MPRRPMRFVYSFSNSGGGGCFKVGKPLIKFCFLEEYDDVRKVSIYQKYIKNEALASENIFLRSVSILTENEQNLSWWNIKFPYFV